MKIASIGSSLLATALTTAVLVAPAAAQSPSPAPMMMSSPGQMTSIDCSKAGDMMTQAGKMDDSATMTGDVDKDFMAMGMMHEKGMMMLMQVEAKCGKDPKVRAAAAKGLRDSEQRLEMFRNQGQS